MKQGYSKALRFISVLLFVAMLMTSQAFTILAAEISEEVLQSETVSEEFEHEQIEEETYEHLQSVTMTEESDTELQTNSVNDVASVSTEESDTLEEIVSIEEPFRLQRNDREQISLNTGAVNYSETIVSLPGIGGSNFTLQINYDSFESALSQHDYYLKYRTAYIVSYRERQTTYYSSGTKTTYGDWTDVKFYNKNGADVFADQKNTYSKTSTVPDSGDSGGTVQRVTKYDVKYRIVQEAYSYGNSTNEQTYYEKRYGLGAGWSFNIPSIQKGNAERLILPGTGAFAVSGNYLKKYPLNDMILSPNSSYNNGQFDSVSKLTFVDGRTYYFDENGLLLADVDRFGNTVTYKYIEVDGEYKPSEITDTAGRKTIITYADSESGKNVIITAPDNSQTILYVVDISDDESETGNAKLEKMVYPDGETIHFDYTLKDAKYSYSSDADEDLKYMLLSEVAYDTGVELHYSYKKVDTDLGSGHLEIYRISERYTADSTDYNRAINKTEYNYTNDFSRNKAYGTKVSEIIGTGSEITEYTFDKNHCCTLNKMYDGETLKKEIVTTYDEYRLPKTVKTTIYSGENSMVSEEYYKHDKFGNATMYISPKGEMDDGDTEYSVKSTYSISATVYSYTGFNLPLTIKQKQNESTTIKVENTLSNDKKSILSSVTKVNNVVKAQTDYTYDANGRVKTETVYPILGGDGITKTYTYDGPNLVAISIGGITDANGNILPDVTESYTYDVMGRQLTHTDASGNVTSTAYDVRGKIISVTAPDGSITEYDYNLVDNKTTFSSDLRESLVYDFDPFGYRESVVYASGELVSESFYDEQGRVVAEATSRNSSAASTAYYAYDAFDRVKEKLVYGADNLIAYRETYEYDDALDSNTSLVTKTVHGNGDVPDLVTETYTNKYGEVIKEDVGGIITQYSYNYVGDPIRTYYGDTTLATYTYDHLGNVTSEKNAAGDTRTVTYDAIGRKIAETDFLGNMTAYTYDNAGRLLTVTTPVTDTLNSVTKYYYDANGNVIKTEQTAQAEGEETQWRTVEQVYDNMNRVTDIITHVSDTEKQYTHYEYDLAGDLTGVYTGMTVPFDMANPDSYSHIAYTYDARGNNTSLTDALGQTESYTYDSLGMVVSATQRDGKVTKYAYNALGSIVSEEIYENSDAETPLSVKTTVYALTGAPLSVTIDDVKTEYTYNAQGSVLTETEGDVVKTYTYDSRGRMSSYTLTVDGETKSTATYSYDDMNRLTSVTEGGLTTTYTYDKNGNRASQTTGEVTTEYAYNKANLVTDMTNTMVNAEGDSVVISSFAYTYYADGNMHTKSETLLDTTANTAYVYDGAGRLVSETTGDKVISYYYDANNNRTLMNNGGVITSYTHDKNNRLLTEGDSVYTYDANGNTLSAGNKAYTYNARGQQIGYTEYAEAVHTFEDGVCTYCGEPEEYMLADADGNGIINFLDFLISMRYYVDTPETLPPQDLDGDGVAGRKDYLIFAREFAGVDENYIPSLLIIDDLLAFADVDGDEEVTATDYLIAYATYYEKEISECLTNGISLKTSMQAADINGDGEITEADKDIGIDYALSGSSTYPIGQTVDNTSDCDVRANIIVTAAQYAYNPSGLRSAKTVGGSTKYFVYNGMQIVFEYEDSISDGTIYYYGLNRTHNSNGEIYVYNAHGDTVQLVKDNAVVVSYTYDAFGNLTSQVGESDNPFLYGSEYFDSETQTYYLRARYYNPANGRFTQQDAWVFMDTSDPLSLNLYTYCFNNPIMYVDPSGCWPDWGKLASGVILVGIGFLTVVAVASTGGAATPVVAAVYAGMATAGTVVAVQGAAEIEESFTGKNVVRDFMGEETYEIVKYGSLAVISIGGSLMSSGSLDRIDASLSNRFNQWDRTLQNTSELKPSMFHNLTNNGIAQGGRSGSDRPTYSIPNSFYSTSNGQHIYVYDNNGKLIYDLSPERVKYFKINYSPSGEEFFKSDKLDGTVPEFLKEMFGW